MSRLDRWFGLTFLVLGLAFVVQASRLPLWRGTTPGSGLFPIVASTVLVVVSALTVAGTFGRASGSGERAAGAEGFLPPPAGLRSQALGLGALVVYSLAFEPLGFALSTFVFLSLLFTILEPARKLAAFALAGAIVVGAYVFLVVLLKMPLPAGLLG